MPVTNVIQDPEALRLVIESRFGAPVERVWQVWADPRQLEKWWGPPTHPATFVDFEFRPDGKASYFMTGPDGEKFHGWWRIISITAPSELCFEDGFADDDGNVITDMPAIDVCIELADSGDGGTIMTNTSTFATTEAMEHVLELGAVEGMTLAAAQIDDLLAAD